jgi:uncharacterized membrane protein
LRLSALVERFRASLFLGPMLAVVAAIVVASVAIWFDSGLDQSGAGLPLGFTSTVESARALLGTIAGATITFAGIAFSVSLLIMQQASSQYSPRVVHTLFRDPFNRRVMGLVVGTFTYCLLILRSVRTAVEFGGDPVIPNLSVAIAVVLGIVTILAIVAFINHSAHAMDISNILHDVEHEAIAQIRREWSDSDPGARPPSPQRPTDPPHTIRFDRSGWIQQLDVDKLTRCIPAGTIMWVDAYPGRYAVAGTPVCALSAEPEDPEVAARDVLAAIRTGDTRTMEQDVSFGLRQLADVALKALSPGINDPTTAQDAIFHSVAVLAELLSRKPPAPPDPPDGCGRVVLVHQPTHEDLIRLAFDEVRQAAAPMPTVCIYLLQALELLTEAANDGPPAIRQALRRQAELVVAGCAAADNLPADLGDVEHTYQTRFGSR